MAVDQVTFKDEGEYGPVYEYDLAVYTAWCDANAVVIGGGIPFGSKPEGEREIGWMTRSKAISYARSIGAQFVEV